MFGETVAVLTYPTILDRGRNVPDYDQAPTAVDIDGCDVQPGASTELLAQRRDATGVRWSVFIPAGRKPDGVLLSERTIMRVRGETFQVDGRPAEWLDGGPLDYYGVLLVAWEIPS